MSVLLPVLVVSARAQAASDSSDAVLRQQVLDLRQRLEQLEKEIAPGHAPAAPAAAAPSTPQAFDFADFTWLNGNSRTHDSPLDTKYFTPEIRVDANYVYDFNNPKDHTLDGSCETGRTNELQLQQLGLGGDFHYDNVRARFMTQFGEYSQMTPRNDVSPSRGQWNLNNAYQYLSEAYGGYHFDVLNERGVNLDAGIFMSYIGLFSYYNADNWAYQPSYVSANTPWFFNGLRVQTFPTDRWKAEFWLINGWQSYGMFNEQPGVGTQQLWRPTGWLEFLSNDYFGADTLGNPARQRYHTDDSVEVKYYDRPNSFIDKGALSFTFDAGCENGGGVKCFTSVPGAPQQDFIGFMLYNRTWFAHDKYALTLGGGAITNPGRYLVLLPSVNGATAATGTPYFTENPGDQFKAWDMSATFDVLTNDYLTWRFEFNHRAADVPYFAGPGGMTPPGGNNGNPGATIAGWTPDLVKAENRFNIALLIKL